MDTTKQTGRTNQQRKRLIVKVTLLAASLLASSLVFSTESADARKSWVNSPLSDDMQRSLERAMSNMRSGHFPQAQQIIATVLEQANDVPKCLAIAATTESYGFPMMEARRDCLKKAYSLCGTNEDMILVALTSRKYQFHEITRQAIGSLIANAKTIPELYDLAGKCQEVALNDVAHLAMEKAYTGLKSEQSAFEFSEKAKALGMEDLLRKVMKEMIDAEDDCTKLCDLIYKFDGYQMRDTNRYGLRKAMDKAATVPEMQNIFELAKRINEPDVANRAQYYVRKGQIIQKIKNDRKDYETQLRAWREGIDLDTARARDGISPSGDGTTTGSTLKRGENPGSGF
jgi:hypothetical protein